MAITEKDLRVVERERIYINVDHLLERSGSQGQELDHVAIITAPRASMSVKHREMVIREWEVCQIQELKPAYPLGQPVLALLRNLVAIVAQHHRQHRLRYLPEHHERCVRICQLLLTTR